MVADQLIPIKTGAGETDLQSRGLFFKHYTFLKESEERSDLATHLWTTATGAHLALYPNLNAQDEVWRELFRDVRFRRALSLGIDRDEINQIMYYGLGIGGNNTVLPQSPLYKPEYRDTWATYDPEQANALLDEIGLTERSAGRPAPACPTAGRWSWWSRPPARRASSPTSWSWSSEAWLDLGIKIHTRPSQREVFRNRIFSGETLMSIWYGLENGIPTADMSPAEFAPTSQQQLQWPKWGQYYETKGQAGEAPDTPEAKELLELFERVAAGAQQRGAAQDLGRRCWRSTATRSIRSA